MVTGPHQPQVFAHRARLQRQTLGSQGRRQRAGTPHLRAPQTAAQGAKHLRALRHRRGTTHARITQRLQPPGLPLPDPAPYRGRAHIQMHRQAGCRPALGRKQTHFHPVSFAQPQPRIAAQLAQSAALPRGHLDVQGVGHEGGGTQGNQRYLRFYLTPTKFHADRLVLYAIALISLVVLRLVDNPSDWRLLAQAILFPVALTIGTLPYIQLLVMIERRRFSNGAMCKNVRSSDYGLAWPLTVESAKLCCRFHAVWVEVNGRKYGVNGTAKLVLERHGHRCLDLNEIWRDHPDREMGNEALGTGRKVNIHRLLQAGFDLEAHSESLDTRQRRQQIKELLQDRLKNEEDKLQLDRKLFLWWEDYSRLRIGLLYRHQWTWQWISKGIALGRLVWVLLLLLISIGSILIRELGLLTSFDFQDLGRGNAGNGVSVLVDPNFTETEVQTILGWFMGWLAWAGMFVVAFIVLSCMTAAALAFAGYLLGKLKLEVQPVALDLNGLYYEGPPGRCYISWSKIYTVRWSCRRRWRLLVPIRLVLDEGGSIRIWPPVADREWLTEVMALLILLHQPPDLCGKMPDLGTRT